MINLIKKICSAIFVRQDGGLLKSGSWRVVYPEGYKTRRLRWNHCRDLRSMFGGKVIWDPSP